MIGGRRGLDVISAIRVVRVAVGSANKGSRAGSSVWAVVVLEIRVFERNGVTRGVGSGCEIRSEALKVSCTLWVAVVSDVTRVLPGHQ